MSSGSSGQSISGSSSSSLLTASSATGFDQKKSLRLLNDLRSDVDTVLNQIPLMTTAIAANQSEVAANHSEVLSQLRLLKVLVVGQHAGLNDLKEKIANTREEVNASEQNSPYTEREERLRHRLTQSRNQLTQSRKDGNLLAQQLRRKESQVESRQSSQMKGPSEKIYAPAASKRGEVRHEL